MTRDSPVGEFRAYGLCERIGSRASMEDAVLLMPCLKSVDEPDCVQAVFGVFDGHGGCDSYTLPELISAHSTRYSDLNTALSECYVRTDELLDAHLEAHHRNTKEFTSGTTGVTVVIQHRLSTNTITVTCANVGDSRCVLVKSDGVSVPLSYDHSPSQPEEAIRIELAGGFITQSGVGSECARVLGSLAVSRALGDFDFKLPRVQDWGTKASPIVADLVLNKPDIQHREINLEFDLALVLACDGIWNVFTQKEIGPFIVSSFQKLRDIYGKKCSKAHQCELVSTAVVELALARGSTDNCTCVVVLLTPEPPSKKSTVCNIM